MGTRFGWRILCGLWFWGATGLVPAGLIPSQLRCEYRSNPLAIDTPTPRLSWGLTSRDRGQTQTAYRILAATSRAKLQAGSGDLWDTGRIMSDQSLHVVYAGRPLRSRDTVFWQVRVWDKRDQPSAWSPVAFWRMGLLARADWQARWISVTNIPAPLSRPNFGFHSQLVRIAETNQWVLIDLGTTRAFDRIELYPAHPYPWDRTSENYLFPRRFRVEVADNTNSSKRQVIVDQTEADVAPPVKPPWHSGFAPVQGRYVRLTVSHLAKRGSRLFGFALAELRVLAGETNVALNARVTASAAFRNGAWSETNLVDGLTVTDRGNPAQPLPAPMLRRTFPLGNPVARATVYASALGLYELRLNGRRVGDHVLAPEWTDYRRRIQYQAYDVTPLLRPGENVLGATLGAGWYAGRIGMSDWIFHTYSRVYGEKPWLLAQLEVEFADGTRRVIATDSSWRATTAGPIRQSDILDGEICDGRRILPGWDEPGFEEQASLPNALSAGEPPGRLGAQPLAIGNWGPVATRDDVTARLVAQPNEPIRVTRQLPPVALTEPAPGVFVFDLGQNLVGWCRLKLRGKAGIPVRLRHAEMLNADGTIYTSNLRGAPQIDRYLPRGSGLEYFEPRFTYHGFRYVEVTGLSRRPQRRDLTAMVIHSDARETAQFACSNPMLNRLWQNILWTQRANLVGVPTDCPQRDERLGWMGDIQAFSQTAIFNMDLGGFFTKWLQDVRDAQADDGRYPDFAPHPFGRNERFAGVPAWGDAGTFVPWRVYVNYGDRRLLEQHYASAKRWVDFIDRHNPDGLWRTNRGNCYNDWLNGNTIKQAGWPDQGGSVPKDVFATAFFAHSTELAAKMARVLGRAAEAEHYQALLAKIKSAFNQQFVEADGKIEGDTQAGYALALRFNLLPPALRPTAARWMVAGVDRYGGHLSTGIQTTHRLMLELARRGYAGTAWQLMTNRTFPSWGYSIDNGATTIWERWDGFVQGRGFQDRGMNSFNHWALGSVGEWMMRNIIGLHPDEGHPAYKQFIIRPRPGGGVTWAKGCYDSIRGRIACAWRTQPEFEMQVTVPPNTTAEVYVPAREPAQVYAGRRPVIEVPGLTCVRQEADCVVVRVGSGAYRFRVRRPAVTMQHWSGRAAAPP